MNVAHTSMLAELDPTEESGLLELLRKIGKGLMATGASVGMVENTLSSIAGTFAMSCEIVALPNILMIKLGRAPQTTIDFSVQRLTSLKLDQIAEMMQLIDKVQRRELPISAAIPQLDRVLAMPHRFGALVIITGFFLSSIGLTLQYQPEVRSLAITGAAGILVGALTLWFQQRPRFNLLLPVIAAALVSTLIFTLTEAGLVDGPATLIVPPLVTFLPGALLTTGMIELASRHILSGSARLMYGLTTLFFLFIGVAAGLNLSDLPSVFVGMSEVSTMPWWAPLLGTLFFGIGTFLRLSGANRDLLWMLVVLYIAMLTQFLGEQLLGPYFGAFFGATAMALSSELIARSPRRTPALAAQMLAFWFLVPGARGLLGVTSLLGHDIQSAAIGIGEMLGLMGAISLGVLLGTLLVSPQKFEMAPGHTLQVPERVT